MNYYRPALISATQQLSWVFGQAHADLARLSGNTIVAVYENRYPVGRPRYSSSNQS